MPALNPDVAVMHAQQADREGNVQLWGITGRAEGGRAGLATASLVTVEEVVDRAGAPARGRRPAHWVVDAVAEVPGGAHPSYAHGYSDRDNAYYRAWDAISRDRDAFTRWLEREVLGAPAGQDQDQDRDRTGPGPREVAR